MSKIQDNLDRVSQSNFVVSTNSILDSFTGADVKEYIEYLQKEVEQKDETIKEYIVENMELRIKLDKYVTKASECYSLNDM